MQELVGKRIMRVLMNDDKTLLVFETRDGERIGYNTEGDCCSESWFSSITGLENLGQGAVVEVIKRPEIVDLPSERQEVDILYGYFLEVGDWRACEIEFRNASNGYYGGSCNHLREITAEQLSQLVEVTKDF